LVRRGDQVEALLETCAHLGGPLADSELDDGHVVCPWHGSRFALEDGQVVGGPSVHDQPALDVRFREGQIEVRKVT
jgi:nitrite reductase/ring-hydroxylating ferredoxin subunit